MKGDIAVAGFRMTAEEWQALDLTSRAELVAVITRKDEPAELAAGSGPVPLELEPDPESGAIPNGSSTLAEDLDSGALMSRGPLAADLNSGAIPRRSALAAGTDSGALIGRGPLAAGLDSGALVIPDGLTADLDSGPLITIIRDEPSAGVDSAEPDPGTAELDFGGC